MTHLDRLLHTTSSRTLREALQAGLSDAPTPELLTKVHSALETGCIVQTQVALAAQGAGNVAPLAASAGAAAKGATAALVLKPLLMGIVGGVLFCGAIAAIETEPAPLKAHATASPVQEPSAQARHAPARRAVPTPDRAPEREVAAAPDISPTTGLNAPSQVAALRPTRVAARAESALAGRTLASSAETAPQAVAIAALSPATSKNGAALRIEIEQIDRVRRALARGDAAQAQAALDVYDRTSKLHVFGREALLLRIETARRRGDDPGACRLVEHYLQEFPGDPQALRLRRIPCAASR
jgi:hypothetical protein